MTTLSHLRALRDLALTHTENPALGMCGRTVEGVARCYLARVLSVVSTHPFDPVSFWPGCTAERQWDRRILDLTDSGTAHALLVALALAHGLDPGVGGSGVLWHHSQDTAWNIVVSDCGKLRLLRFGDVHIACEPNPIAALELAVKHTLEQS